jgi:hypothetical protein
LRVASRRGKVADKPDTRADRRSVLPVLRATGARYRRLAATQRIDPDSTPTCQIGFIASFSISYRQLFSEDFL